MAYEAFLASKQVAAPEVGFEVAPEDLNDALFPWQKRLVAWALKRGRAALFERVGRWLRKTERFGVVLLEPGYGGGCEIPDVLGFKGPHSVLIECKASLADFRADKKKLSRNDQYAGGGMGTKRWYFAIRGLIPPEEVPKSWGLLELVVRSDRVYRTVVPADGDARDEVGLREEVRLLTGCMARVQRRDNGWIFSNSIHREHNFGGLL